MLAAPSLGGRAKWLQRPQVMTDPGDATDAAAGELHATHRRGPPPHTHTLALSQSINDALLAPLIYYLMHDESCNTVYPATFRLLYQLLS